MKTNKRKISSLLKVSPTSPSLHEERPFPAIKIIVILGQTATGKSDLAVRIAKKFGGEVISADSRQVYKGLDIGSGKITKREMSGVPHHLLDIANPKRQFSVALYKKLADKKIEEINSGTNTNVKHRVFNIGKLPIIVGGTGFYIQAIVDGILLPKVKPNYRLRKELERKSVNELFTILKKLDSVRAKEIEKDNPRRLIRAIEIAEELGKIPKLIIKPKYEVLQIGLKLPEKTLKKKIHKRLQTRMHKSMVAEAKRLHKQGLSFKRMQALGLEYRFLAQYLQGKIEKNEMLTKLETAIWHFAKRQMRWFKRDKRIKWFKPSEVRKIEKEVYNFLDIKSYDISYDFIKNERLN